MEKTPKVDWDAPVTPEDVERDVAEELSEMAGFASNWIDSFLDGKIDALVNMMAIAHIGVLIPKGHNETILSRQRGNDLARRLPRGSAATKAGQR